MNYCEECGGKLIKTQQSEYLVCSNCGLVSDFRIYLYPYIKKEKIINEINESLTYSKILKKVKLPIKYQRKLTDKILIKAKLYLNEKENNNTIRKKIYELIRNESINKSYTEYLRIAKEYKNLSKVFLNGNGSEIIFEAIALIYYMRKNKINISFEKVAKIFGIAKNNLFRRYKEFEKRIKIYEKQDLKRLIIMKMLGQPRLNQLTLKEISLIAGVRHDSARALQMKIKRMNIVDKKELMAILIGKHEALHAGGGI